MNRLESPAESAPPVREELDSNEQSKNVAELSCNLSAPPLKGDVLPEKTQPENSMVVG